MPAISTNTAANSAVRYLNINSMQETSALSKLSSGSLKACAFWNMPCKTEGKGTADEAAQARLLAAAAASLISRADDVVGWRDGGAVATWLALRLHTRHARRVELVEWLIEG